MIIAIDGPAGSGKTSTAKAVAKELGYAYLDTGAMYRAITLAALRAGSDLSEGTVAGISQDLKLDIRYENEKMQVYLNGLVVTKELRSEAINQNVSLVSSYRVVRKKLVASQREIANRIVHAGSGVVIDGRDIGTVVFPEAALKIFMNASPEVRARRRYRELKEQGVPAVFEKILENIQERDRFDSERTHAPLRQADDAVQIDTTSLSFEEQVLLVVNKAVERQVRSDV